MLKSLPVALGVLLLGVNAGSGAAEAVPHGAPAVPPGSQVVYPMQAALVQSLSSKSLAPGGHVLAKLETDWTNGTCTLAKGAVVRGDVLRTQAWSPANKKTAVTVLFHYSCPGGDPQVATWIALLAGEDPDLAGLHDGNPVAMQSFRSSSFGQAGNVAPAGNDQGSHVDMSGRQNPNLPVFLDPAKDHAQPRPKQVKTGEVWRVPDVSLEVGAGPDNSTVIESRKKTLHVPAGSAIVLLPESLALVASAPASTPGGTGDSVGAARIPPPKPSFHESTACERPSCTRDGDAAGVGAGARPIATLSLARLRHRQQRAGEMRDLAEDEAVAFLGRSRLLFTYDPHTLVTREQDDRAEDRPHTVRAVLLDAGSGRVERTVEWRVPDSRAYLWPMAADRVLIHSGRRLEWLGADMKPRPAFTADGPIAFVRLAPDRRHVAVGVFHELHSHDEHAEMAAVEPNGPEEQVAVHVLNAELQPVSVSYESSRALPPVLMNRGRVVLLHMGGQRWHYVLLPWGVTSQADGTSVAYVSSSCLPRMSSAGADLMLVTGCDSRSIDHWYRVLRMDGSLVLKGELHPDDLPPLPAEAMGEDTFALAVASGEPRSGRSSLVRAEDLHSETVRVHRASDGATVFALRVEEPVAEGRPMALDDDRLAVLDGSDLRLYALEERGAAAVPEQRAGSH